MDRLLVEMIYILEDDFKSMDKTDLKALYSIQRRIGKASSILHHLSTPDPSNASETNIYILNYDCGSK